MDNGVELRIRREVQSIRSVNGERWKVIIRHWEPSDFVQAMSLKRKQTLVGLTFLFLVLGGAIIPISFGYRGFLLVSSMTIMAAILLAVGVLDSFRNRVFHLGSIEDIVKQQGEKVVGFGGQIASVSNMLVGGSGSSQIQVGVTVDVEEVHAKYIINCAGGASDKIAQMIGDHSFKIKPRIGDYILLNRQQVSDWPHVRLRLFLELLQHAPTNNSFWFLLFDEILGKIG